MAALNLFRYFYRKSVIHLTDARCKLFCLLVFGIATLQAQTWGMILLSALLLMVYLLGKLPLQLLRPFGKMLLIWLPLMILVPGVAMEGTAIADQGFLSKLTYEGLSYGLGFAWKFVLFMGISIVLTSTATTRQISHAVAWYLKPMPARVSATVSTMIQLILAQTPVIFDAYQQINSAQQARLGNRQSNWGVKRLYRLLPPLLYSIFTRADELAYAMESRCFNYRRTQTSDKMTLEDVVKTILFCGVCVVCMVW